MTFNQCEFDIRCEWGENGVHQLAPISDAVIIVDVLSLLDLCGHGHQPRCNDLSLSLSR